VAAIKVPTLVNNRRDAAFYAVYFIVHNDTSDLHEHSVNSKWRHNSQRTPPRGEPSHTNPGPTKTCTHTARDKQKTDSRI